MKTRNLMAIVSAMILIIAGNAQAANYYWDSNGTSVSPTALGDTAGTWGTSAYLATVPSGILAGTAATASPTNTSSDAMYFGTMNLALGSTASTIAIAAAGVTNNIIVFGAGQGSQAVTLSGGGGSITLAGTTPTITVNNTADTINSVLAGSVAVTISGPGTLNLAGANTLSGGAILKNGGTLVLDYTTQNNQ